MDDARTGAKAEGETPLVSCDTPVIWDPRSWLRVAVLRGRSIVTVTVLRVQLELRYAVGIPKSFTRTDTYIHTLGFFTYF